MRTQKARTSYHASCGAVSARNAGQTLIETIVAIGLLAMGIVGGLSLAIFALYSSDATINQIVATGLAREGVEVIRSMRDTNWMQDTLSSNCDFIGSNQPCYQNWLNKAYDIQGSASGRSYRVLFNPTADAWTLEATNAQSNFALYLGTGGSYVHVPASGNSIFYRKVTIDRNHQGLFSPQNPRLVVTAMVWWKGHNCPNPVTRSLNNGDTACRVIVEDYLTNWKNY